MVLALGIPILTQLVAEKRNEEPELGDLRRNRLDVHAVNAVLDQVKLAGVVRVMLSLVKLKLQRLKPFLTFCRGLERIRRQIRFLLVARD